MTADSPVLKKLNVPHFFLSTRGVCSVQKPSFSVASVATMLDIPTIITLHCLLPSFQTEQNHHLLPKHQVQSNMTFAFVLYNLHLKNMESLC